MAATKKTKVIASGVSPNLQKAIDSEWTATERSDDAEEALLRELHYHMLRVAELKRFLHGCGMTGDE
jgi:cytochrome b